MTDTSPTEIPLTDWHGEHGLPEFTRIEDEAFAAAFDTAIAEHLQQIAMIRDRSEPPTIENTLIALELAGESLSRVASLFFNRASAHTNDTIRALEREIAPKLAGHSSAILQDAKLFARIDALWKARDELGLDEETSRVLEKSRKAFMRSGAALDETGRQRLSEIDQRLAFLGAQFGQNVLADEAGWALAVKDEDELAGLPDDLRAAMAGAAREHGLQAGHAVTLSRSIIEPFLAFADNRELREKAFRAWTSRGEGENDNRPVMTEILELRREKARLLGYDHYAAYKLDDTMAKSADRVSGLLDQVWQRATAKAAGEAKALETMIREEGRNHALEAWDWRYYARKHKAQSFDLDEAGLKPHLALDNMIEAAFDVAHRLFGVRFQPRPDIAAWHEDVRVWEMTGSDGKLAGIFFGDYFARPSKRSGAWMSALQSSHGLKDGRLPFICNTMNFAKPAEGSPALLSMDDARTLFHEFGHALHGLLSKARYPSVSGTSVARDFVELPSQLYEHWLTVPEILRKHARHVETDEPIDEAMIAKLEGARNANAGFETVEYTASALVDLAFHVEKDGFDPMTRETEILEELDMPQAIVMRHRSPHFQHVFAGDGYSAGYYAYMWSEVLDADAFRAFEEKGDPFDPELAARLRDAVYASGGTRDPEAAYRAFRGTLPGPEAMMEGRGLGAVEIGQAGQAG